MRNVNEGGDNKFFKQSRKRERGETEKEMIIMMSVLHVPWGTQPTRCTLLTYY